jgi:uncharacterized integral membrane protein
LPGQRTEPALPADAGTDSPARDGAESVPAAEQTRPDPPVPDEHQAVPAEAGPETVAPADHKIRHTRLSGTWMAVILFAVILVLLLIFILQNGHTVDVSYMGVHGHLPLGVALLLAAVAGVLLTAMAGSARIMQLRATARKHRRADEHALKNEARAMETRFKSARKGSKTRN